MIVFINRVLGFRHRISTQLYIGIGGAVLLTVAASLVGWLSFNVVSEAQSKVNEQSVPELVAAFGVAQHSGTLVVAAPRLTTALNTAELSDVVSGIGDATIALDEQLEVLSRSEVPGDNFTQVQESTDRLLANIEGIRDARSKIFWLRQVSDALRTELIELRITLDDLLVAAVDDQLFYTMTGYYELGEKPDLHTTHFSEEALRRYRLLADLQADASNAGYLLEVAYSVSERPLLEPLRERFESSAGRIERTLSALQQSEIYEELAPLLRRLIAMGVEGEGGFDLLSNELELIDREANLLASNQEIAVALLAAVDGLVNTANAKAQEATRASTQATLTGRTLLAVIGATAVGGALIIAWLFVGRVLLRRLELLSTGMRRMASGDLDARVRVSGRDEVYDMGIALEQFRLEAIRARRLDEVEKLSGELQAKNEELESTLDELNRARDQIVSREKLAALGELTAGVAHEIRNPLNFVKNFSEGSQELLVELREIVDESKENFSEDQSELMDEIAQDLNDNLTRIMSHGERANRIVVDMLSMGRGTSEFQAVDINKLVDEYARLAFHSARATDSNFQIDLQWDLDPEAGELSAIPQDLGRVFLNIVSNACFATDERRKNIAAAGRAEGEERYLPTLWISTKKLEEGVKVTFKDNGTGMSEEVMEKIFNPFFTTKPTGQGTGLGMALAADIVREHAGHVSVQSVVGEGTEISVDIPIQLEGTEGEA